MNILILGGTGYLGNKIAKRMYEKKHYVVCTYRNTSRGLKVSANSDGMKWIFASVEAVENEMKKTHFDYVINAMCNYGRNGALDREVIETNVNFPLQVLECAIYTGVKNYLSIGTGLPPKLNLYSLSKSIFSEYGAFYANENKINFANVKLEMFYGADEPEDRFLPSVIRKMINGEIVEVTMGIQHRDIIFIDDVLNALEIIVENRLSGYNDIPVGTGVAPTIAEVIDYIWEKTGKKAIVHKGAIPSRRLEPNCVADLERMSQLCNWQPVDWKTGIANMIKTISEIIVEN